MKLRIALIQLLVLTGATIASAEMNLTLAMQQEAKKSDILRDWMAQFDRLEPRLKKDVERVQVERFFIDAAALRIFLEQPRPPAAEDFVYNAVFATLSHQATLSAGDLQANLADHLRSRKRTLELTRTIQDILIRDVADKDQLTQALRDALRRTKPFDIQLRMFDLIPFPIQAVGLYLMGLKWGGVAVGLVLMVGGATPENLPLWGIGHVSGVVLAALSGVLPLWLTSQRNRVRDACLAVWQQIPTQP